MIIVEKMPDLLSHDGVFQLNPDASVTDLQDAFDHCSAQAESLAILMTGEGFGSWSAAVLNGYGRALSLSIKDMRVLHTAITEKMNAGAQS